MAEAANRQQVRFGAFELDLGNGILRKNGTRVRIQPKPFQLLVMLIERHGNVVTRDELRKRLWPEGTYVDFEHGLNTAVKKLREVLADDPNNPTFVETLPRQGYRFVATIDVVAPEAGAVGSAELIQGQARQNGPSALEAPPLVADASRQSIPASASERRHQILILTGLIITLAAVAVAWRFEHASKSMRDSDRVVILAVLPLENLSHDPAQEYFTDGITDLLIGHLAKISALRVISRRSVSHYKGSQKSVRQIASELGVDVVVDGTVLRSGDRVRITARLVNAKTDTYMWAESYDREVRDVMTMQNELARAIANAVQVRMSPDEKTRLAVATEVDPEAQDAYLRGRYYWNNLSDGGCEKGIPYFEQAIARSPNFAPGYAGLADCYVHWSSAGGPVSSREAYAKAREAALKAISLDDSLAEAHAAMGSVFYMFEWNWRAAEREFKRSIELNPSFSPVHLFYASYLLVMGRKSDGLEELKRARLLDPISQTTNNAGAFVLIMAHEYDQAIEQLRKFLMLYPNLAVGHYYLAASYYAKGLAQPAKEEWLRAETLSGSSKDEVARLQIAYDRSGMPGIFKMFAQRLEADSKTHRVKTSMIAEYYSAGGESDVALAYLEKAVQERDDGLIYLKVNPHFHNLHQNDRFIQIARQIGLP